MNRFHPPLPRSIPAIGVLVLATLVGGCAPSKRPEPSGPKPASAPIELNGVLTHTGPFSLPPGFPASAEHVIDEQFAPAPFTARQIAQACPVGRTNTFAMTMETGDYVMVHRFTEVSPEGATIQRLFGEVRGDTNAAAPDLRSEVKEVAWSELQRDASFPREKTRIRSERISVRAGTYDCWRYDVIEGATITHHWFAKGLAGPPVKIELHRDGKLFAVTELTEIRLR
ncbi:MAG: hypothetical protein ACO4CW_06535 [Planctomycetota bacterium]